MQQCASTLASDLTEPGARRSTLHIGGKGGQINDVVAGDGRGHRIGVVVVQARHWVHLREPLEVSVDLDTAQYRPLQEGGEARRDQTHLGERDEGTERLRVAAPEVDKLQGVGKDALHVGTPLNVEPKLELRLLVRVKLQQPRVDLRRRGEQREVTVLDE